MSSKGFDKISKVLAKASKALEADQKSIKRTGSHRRTGGRIGSEVNMPVNVKKIRKECDEMSAAWEQAGDVEFNGVKKTDFDGDRMAARAIETEIEEDEAALRAKKARRDDHYRRLDAARVKVSKGVGGHKDFGEDSALYGAMGFVRKSERRSGLRRPKRPNQGTA